MAFPGEAKILMWRIIAASLGLGLIWIAFFTSNLGFQQVLDFRQLERIPLSSIADSIGGESQLKGRAQPYDELVEAPKSGHMSIYYQYMLEREETDSDGNTSWRVVRDEYKTTDFLLADASATAQVKTRGAGWRLTFSVAQKYRKVIGDYRHTEWRIDPGDELTIFGWLDHTPEPVITFLNEGQYQPILSSFGAGSERARIAITAVLWLWCGVSVLILACFLAAFALQIHKTLVFLILVSLLSGLMMFHYGYRSVVADVQDGFTRTETQWQRADGLVKARLAEHDLLPIGLASAIDLSSLAYSELDATDRRQIDAWRVSAFEVRARYLLQTRQIPDRWIARSMGMSQPAPVKLPQNLQRRADEALQRYQATRISDSVPTTWLVLGLMIITALMAWFSFRAIATKRMQENIPTSKSAGVVFGLAEVKGELVAESDSLLKGPVSDEECCWYHYTVKEKRGSGKNSKWVTVIDEIKKQPFFCRDDEGKIRIFPGRAECISQHVATRRSGNRSYHERRLSPGDNIYVLGRARLDKTRGDTLVFSHGQGSPYIIANIPEEAVMFRKAMKGMALLSLSLSALFLGALFIGGSSGHFSSLDFFLAAMISPLFMLFVMLVLMYNDLVFLRQRCDRNWSNIEVSLKKRADLVPQLEQVVKQYLGHESSLQTALAQLRADRGAVSGVEDADAYMAAEHALIGELNLKIEAYPDLEGIDLIAVFNRRLIKLENEVSLMRAGFNDAVTQYETRRHTFPDVLLARLFGFGERDLLQYNVPAHSVPSVHLRSSS